MRTPVRIGRWWMRRWPRSWWFGLARRAWLLGENGLLRTMTKAVLERGLAEELGYEPQSAPGPVTSSNGSMPKRLHTEARHGRAGRPP
jgi:hypothetical protein